MSFEFPVRVYWEDTDAGGIVFYANYLKFFERARTEWLRHLGLEQQQLKNDTGGMFRLQDKGRASLVIAQQAWRLEPDQSRTLLCEGTIRIGWVQAQVLKPERIPSSILELLS